VDVLGAAGCGAVGLGEFAGSGGEADAESFGFAGPAFAFGFGDAGEEVVADLFEAAPLGGVDAQERAPDAGFSELTVLVSYVRFLIWIWESGGMGDCADGEGRVAAVDADQGVVEADEGSAGDAGG
jgi:hypothetical protein